MKGNLSRYINFFNNIVLEKTNWELTKLVTQKNRQTVPTLCSFTMNFSVFSLSIKINLNKAPILKSKLSEFDSKNPNH